jgi:hypothetical protein
MGEKKPPPITSTEPQRYQLFQGQYPTSNIKWQFSAPHPSKIPQLIKAKIDIFDCDIEVTNGIEFHQYQRRVSMSPNR